MTSGVGIDMIEVERVAEKINKEIGFREMVFSKTEIAYCESKKNKFESYAARFAAKEAFFKALGTGWAENTQFNEVEIITNKEGKPEVQLLGSTLETINAMGIKKILVSLSHIKTIASAVVMIEK
ncbi:holo-ACP synthase [Mucilaginibacter sp. McL0603]|uniref:holo-ACP synthase n=1 Tax=Mucilaginibacter sp. McL0603 TaxID=3415670 RepID=UPI003CEF301C